MGSQASCAWVAKSRRPIHHAGLPLAKSHAKKITILPSAIAVLGPHMTAVSVNASAGWAVSCGKDVLAESVEGQVPEQNTTVVVRHQQFYVGIGIVTATSGRVIKMQCDVGSLLRM